MRALLAVQPLVQVDARARRRAAVREAAPSVLDVEGAAIQHARAPVRALVGQEAAEEVVERCASEGTIAMTVERRGRAAGPPWSCAAGGAPAYASGALTAWGLLLAGASGNPAPRSGSARVSRTARTVDDRASPVRRPISPTGWPRPISVTTSTAARALAHHLQTPLQHDVQRVRGIALAEEDLVPLEVDPGQLALDAAAGGRRRARRRSRLRAARRAGMRRATRVVRTARTEGCAATAFSKASRERRSRRAGVPRARSPCAGRPGAARLLPRTRRRRRCRRGAAGPLPSRRGRRAVPPPRRRGRRRLRPAGRALRPRPGWFLHRRRRSWRGRRPARRRTAGSNEGRRACRAARGGQTPPRRARRQARVSSGSARRRSRPSSS